MTELFSRHAQRFIGFAVVTAAVGESGVKNRRRHALPFRQRFAQTASAPGLLPGFRRHSGSRFKQPM
ncbi:Uncharacterised protein [Shigella sonnei]|nr:Uncharacterised protein [Shigella sonnei]CSP96394.1 Uncharacterised protein [Shigella sonnei]